MSNSIEDTDINNTPLNLSVVNQSISFKCPVDLTIRESAVETLREDIPAVENMSTVSNKRKLEEEQLKGIPLVKKPNSLHEVENQIHEDVNKDKTSRQVPIVIQHTQSQHFQCTDSPQANSSQSSQFGIVNPPISEAKIFQIPSIEEKNKHISIDSGISVQDTPSPTLVLCDSLEEETEAALLKVDECHALDLSTTNDPIIKVRELTCNNCDETCALSESSRPELHPSCEMPVVVHMPPLNPDQHENKPGTNVAKDFAYEKSSDLEMPNVVSEMKCRSQDTCSSNVAVDIVDVKQLEKLKKSEQNVDLSKDTACASIANDSTNEAVNSSNVFEAKTVAIGTFGETPHILHGSESDANLQNISQVTYEPVSCENQNMKESKDKEELNILHNDAHKVDTQNTNTLTFSSEHKNIQQEAICSESEREIIDIGTFENSGCLNTSNILNDCKNDNALNASSSTNVANPLLPIECQNNKDKDSHFAQLCEEVTKSFNDIESDLSESDGSYYELVEDADVQTSGSECDWGPVQKNLDRLCKSICADNEDSDPSAMCC